MLGFIYRSDIFQKKGKPPSGKLKMSTKKAIKSIKAQLEDKNSEAAVYEATALLKTLKKDEAEVPQM